MEITKRGLVVGATVVVFSTVAIAGANIHPKVLASFNNSPKELVDEVWQIVDRNYVDATFNQVDWDNVRNQYLNRQYTSKDEAYKAIREMLEKLKDPYTRFMDPKEFQNMQIDTRGELTGVGLQLAQDEETKKLVVVAPIEETPAFKAGILAKDEIVKIDGKSTEGMDVNQAVQLIRGEANTKVILTIQRGKQQLEFPLTRTRIEIHPVRHSVRQTPSGKIGYIRLIQFSENAAGEMRSAIQDLEKQKVDGYILDLRSNPGGLLQASIEIARMWLEKGTIVSTVNRQGVTDKQSANNRALTKKPMVILVDGGSASASEILSGALQDNNRGVLVGTKTFGKGLVQSVRGLNDGSGLAVTIAKYLTPSGRDINKHGIDPDVVFDLSDEQKLALRKDNTKIGTPDDPQYVKGLEILRKEIVGKQGNRAESAKQKK
ncbi:MAG TPA: carboxyl-terminal processing protease CtpC [Halomicronema sp.]